MKLLFLTPGTGSYYCGVCMRDNALAKQLCLMGHDAVLLPLYLPLTLEETAASPASPVLFGGLNVYLQQRFPWFRTAPPWLDRWLDHPKILKWLGRFSGMTQGADTAAITLSMLQGEVGAQNRELDKLVDWILQSERPDVIWLSTGLLGGVARRLKRETGVPVFCSLQGEDSFLDGLPEPWKTEAWKEMGVRLRELDGVVAPSRFFAGVMEARLGWQAGTIQVVPNGMALEGYGPSLTPTEPPVVGYLARFIQGKGLGTVVEAFIELHRRGKVPRVRLRCAGTMIAGDVPYLEQQRELLRAAGVLEQAEFLPNISRDEKIHFLQSLSLLSVPASYGEAFGLYLLEAMACGVPVVQPRMAAFPEILEATGGGVLVESNTAAALADAWEELLLNPSQARRLGAAAREAVERDFSMPCMAAQFLTLSQGALVKES
ncbi:MAG: Glycosyltransferase involved in cell wall bisynthesis [Verrucomicrobia bacterium]|nr:MAG: Glycosyltransferase involved in cell wall bisynthesis [Verrucomicrobiota bacterium]